MTFTIPNEADATHEGQAELDAVDLAELVEGFAGTGVVSGGVVTEDSVTPDQTVEFTTCVYQIAGATYTATASSVTCSDATGFTTGYEAWDLIVANTSSAVVLKAGTPAAPGEAVFPALDANTVLLAAVHRSEGDNTIVNADIVQKQVPRFLEGDATGDLYLDTNTLYGGRADGETLTLQGNATDFRDAVVIDSPIRVLSHDPTWSAAANNDGFMLGWPAARSVTMDYASWGLSAITAAGSVIWGQAAAVFGGVQFFGDLVQHKNPSGTAVNGVLNTHSSFYAGPTFTAQDAAYTVGTITAFANSPTFTETGASGAMAVSSLTSFSSSVTASNATTITNRTGVIVNVAVLSGGAAVTNQRGIIVGPLDNATNNVHLLIGTTTSPSGDWAIYSASAAESLITGPLRVGSATGPTVQSGTGTPEAAVTAPVGSLFLRDDGGASTTLYVKESGTGNTGWVAK